MKNNVIFVSGPITGVENYEKQFQEAAERIREMGFLPLLPIVLPPGMEHSQYMHICFAMIDMSAMVVFLPYWGHSKGSMMEFDYCNAKGKKYSVYHGDGEIGGWDACIKQKMEEINHYD